MATDDPTTVSVILASHDRSQLLEVVVACFLQQRSVHRLELVILDDSLSPVSGWIRDTCDVVDVSRGMSLGEKLNIGASRSCGSILMKWDDDDFYGPGYVDRSVQALQTTGAQVVFAQPFLIFDATSGRLCLTDSTRCSGATLTLRRALWESVPFRAVQEATDSEFLLDVIDRSGTDACCGMNLDRDFIQLRHGKHLWTRMPDGRTVEAYIAECASARFSVEEVVGPIVLETWREAGSLR